MTSRTSAMQYKATTKSLPEIARELVREVELQLTPAEVAQLAARKPVNAEAQLECLRSRHATYSGTIEGTEIGLRYARHAIELDPEYAFGWVALADGHLLRAIRGIAPVADAGGAHDVGAGIVVVENWVQELRSKVRK